MRLIILLYTISILLGLVSGCARGVEEPPPPVPGCATCEEDLEDRVGPREFAFPPGPNDVPITFTYKTAPNGCMVASSVCNPGHVPQPNSFTAFIVTFKEITQPGVQSKSISIPSPGEISTEQNGLEYKCSSDGDWQIQGGKQRAPVGSIFCVYPLKKAQARKARFDRV